MDYKAFCEIGEIWIKHLNNNEDISLEELVLRSKENERFRNVCAFYIAGNSKLFHEFIGIASNDKKVKQMLVNLYHSLSSDEKEIQSISKQIKSIFADNPISENEQPDYIVVEQMVKTLRSMVRQYNLQLEYPTLNNYQ